jgi:hypothetical protein
LQKGVKPYLTNTGLLIPEGDSIPSLQVTGAFWGAVRRHLWHWEHGFEPWLAGWTIGEHAESHASKARAAALQIAPVCFH